MKANKSIKYILPCMTVLALALAQAHAAESAGATVTGEITAKLYGFDYTGGPGVGLTPYLQSYGGQQSWDGDRESGAYADLDLDLAVSGENGDILTLERQGFGLDNHRGSLRGGSSSVGFNGYYSHYRSNSHGVDYVNRPGTADNPTDPDYFTSTSHTNSGFLSKFNDDSHPDASFHTERTRYGVGVKFKPGLLGKGTSLSLNFDGYNRDGNKFATWVAGNGDFTNGPAAVPNNDPDTTGIRTPQRWRGYDKPVDEKMGKMSLNFTASPAGLFQFAYDGSYEKFNNQSRTVLLGDVAGSLTNGVTVTPNMSEDWPMHFYPDSTLITHAVRASKTFGNTAVAAGFGVSKLEQDSFHDIQIAAGYVGKISTENAFVNLNHRLSPTVGLEGYVKYYNRDNDSPEDAPGLLDRTVRDEWGVRIANIESLTYGLSASFRGLPAKSSLTAGWKREDSDRVLLWNTIPTFDNLGQWPTQSLLSEETVSDEIYLKWVARPMPGMTLRVTPSYIWADKTALVTLPETSLNLKMAVSYVVNDGMQVGAYYNVKDKENNNNSFTDTLKTPSISPTPDVVTLGNEYSQKADDTFHAAGVSLNLVPMERLNASVGLDWMQNDFETYFFGTNVRRFESNIVFDPRGTSTFKVDTWSLSFNGEFQASERLKLSAGYSLSKSDGDLRTVSATTVPLPEDTVNDKIDNTLHSLMFGANYNLKKNMTLRGSYVYDKYDDDAYSSLSGSAHTLMAGVSFALK